MGVQQLTIDVVPHSDASSFVAGQAGYSDLLVSGSVSLRSAQPTSVAQVEVRLEGTLSIATHSHTLHTPLLAERVVLVDCDTLLTPDSYSLPFMFAVSQADADALPPSMAVLAVWKARVEYRIIVKCTGDGVKETSKLFVLERHPPATLDLMRSYESRNLEINGDSRGIRYRIRAPKILIPNGLYEVVYRFEKTPLPSSTKFKEDRLKRIEIVLTEKVWLKSDDGKEKSFEYKFPMTVEKERCVKSGWDNAAKYAFRLPHWSAIQTNYTGTFYIEKHHRSDLLKFNFLNCLNPSGDWGPIRVGHSILFSIQYKHSGRKQHVFPVTVLGATHRGILENPDYKDVLETGHKLDEQAVNELNGKMSDEEAMNLAMLESFLDPMVQPPEDEDVAISRALDQSALMAVFGGEKVPVGEILSAKKHTKKVDVAATDGGEQDLVNAGFTEDEAMFISLHASKYEQKVGVREEDPFEEKQSADDSTTGSSQTNAKKTYEFEFGKFEKSGSFTSSNAASPEVSVSQTSTYKNSVTPSLATTIPSYTKDLSVFREASSSSVIPSSISSASFSDTTDVNINSHNPFLRSLTQKRHSVGVPEFVPSAVNWQSPVQFQQQQDYNNNLHQMQFQQSPIMTNPIILQQQQQQSPILVNSMILQQQMQSPVQLQQNIVMQRQSVLLSSPIMQQQQQQQILQNQTGVQQTNPFLRTSVTTNPFLDPFN